MSEFIFSPPDDYYSFDSQEQAFLQRPECREQLANLARSMHDTQKSAPRKAASGRSRDTIVALRMPSELLQRLDSMARDAATNRSHLLRQTVADYLNCMKDRGLSFRGSLLSIDNGL